MNRSNVRVLRMRGLPFSACNSDITEFFRDYHVEDVRIGMRQGKPTGEAFVRFSDERNCSDALAQLDKQMLGKRYIDERLTFEQSVRLSTACRLFKAKDQDLESSLPEVSISGKCNVIRMRGLPFSACMGDILDFFKNIPALDTENIYFVYDSSGRPSGEAYISFLSSDACTTAMKLHKNKMGSRYIELFPSSSIDLQRAAKQRKLRLAKTDGSSVKAQVSNKHLDSKSMRLHNQGEPSSKQQGASEKPAQTSLAAPAATLTPAPAAPPLRRTFASITAAPPTAVATVAPAAATTAPATVAPAPQPAPIPVSPPVVAHKKDEHLSLKLGALELDVSRNEQQGLSPPSADAQQTTAAAAAAAVLESGNTISGDGPGADISGYALPQQAHSNSQHVASGVALSGHEMMGSSGIPRNGISQTPMGSGSVIPPQTGGFVPDQMAGYHRHGVLAGAATGYALHRGSEYGGMTNHAMLAGGNQMQYTPAANMQFSGGAHMASPQLRGPPGQAPAAGNNRQNVPPNVPPPPMTHDEVWNMWGQASVPGGIRDLWQSDMSIPESKKPMPQTYGSFQHNSQFAPYHMGPAQQDFGYGHGQAPYYSMDGRQGTREGYREY